MTPSVGTLTAAFYKGRTRLFNRAVSWWDSGPYSHCELEFADGLSGSSSFLDGWVRLKHIVYDPEHWDRFTILADVDYARQWFVDHDGWKYDVRGDIWFVLGSPAGVSTNKVFCSSAFMSALQFPDSWRFTPNTARAAIDPLILGRL